MKFVSQEKPHPLIAVSRIITMIRSWMLEGRPDLAVDNIIKTKQKIIMINLKVICINGKNSARTEHN